MKTISRRMPSESTPGRHYETTVALGCQCSSFTFRSDCKHVRTILAEMLPEKPKKEYRAPGERRRRRSVTLPDACPECAGTTASRDHQAKVWLCFNCSTPMPEVKVALP